MSKVIDQLLDRLAMSQAGSGGNTLAHWFLQDRVSRPIGHLSSLRCLASQHGPVRIFVPPKPEDRIVMFRDNSGVYVFHDFFCTLMGANISKEVGQWQELSTAEF